MEEDVKVDMNGFHEDFTEVYLDSISCESALKSLFKKCRTEVDNGFCDDGFEQNLTSIVTEINTLVDSVEKADEKPIHYYAFLVLRWCESSLMELKNNIIKLPPCNEGLVSVIDGELSHLRETILTGNSDEMQRIIEEGARSYSLRYYKEEDGRLIKEAGSLITPWRPLTDEHWYLMKDSEERALRLASEGNLVSSEEKCFSIYGKDWRRSMESHGAMLGELEKCLSDNDIFDFSRLFGVGCGFCALNYKNIDEFYWYVLRSNIIRYHIYPELKPKFEAWMKGETYVVKVEDKKINTKKKVKKNVPYSGFLSSSHAEVYWEKLRKADVVDKNNKPLNLSWNEKSQLASILAKKLGIKFKWKEFGQYWSLDVETLRSSFNKGMESATAAAFENKITNILG